MSSLNIDEFISSSISANKEIYNLVKNFSKELKNPLSKGFGGDMSLGVDMKSEEIFIKYLSKYGKIFSEESGEIGSGEFTIVIDPLDGSDNFKSNFPYFGTSVAIRDDNKVLVAMITNLANGDLFIKTKKEFVKGKLFEKDFYEVDKNRFSTLGIFEKGYKSKIISKKLREKEIKYRIPGAVALSLAYAHEVDFVLFEGKLREFDVCAGRYMCEDLYIYESDDIFIVSKNIEMFKVLRDLI